LLRTLAALFAPFCLACAACGAGRTELGVPEDPPTDASLAKDTAPEPDATPPDASPEDAARDVIPEPDAYEAASCAPVVQIYLASDGLQCKYDITWTCGGIQYEALSGKPGGSGCDPTTDFSEGFRGICFKDGMQTAIFEHHDPSGCSCSDPLKLAALVAKACGFPL